VDESTQTVFKFTAEGVDMEFAGTEAFVEQQLARFRKFLQSAVGLPEEAPAADPKEDGQGPMGFDLFAQERPIRGGRGAIQDSILLAIYYLQAVQRRRDVSGRDILHCFHMAGWEEPKNLHNALGVLKRKLGFLQEGSQRGLYQLSPLGVQHVEGRFRPA
jgi:hypothetical protein